MFLFSINKKHRYDLPLNYNLKYSHYTKSYYWINEDIKIDRIAICGRFKNPQDAIDDMWLDAKKIN
jgi:hypothetical protein